MNVKFCTHCNIKDDPATGQERNLVQTITLYDEFYHSYVYKYVEGKVKSKRCYFHCNYRRK